MKTSICIWLVSAKIFRCYFCGVLLYFPLSHIDEITFMSGQSPCRFSHYLSDKFTKRRSYLVWICWYHEPFLGDISWLLWWWRWELISSNNMDKGFVINGHLHTVCIWTPPGIRIFQYRIWVRYCWYPFESIAAFYEERVTLHLMRINA
jgi:hypothetical protein